MRLAVAFILGLVLVLFVSSLVQAGCRPVESEVAYGLFCWLLKQ